MACTGLYPGSDPRDFPAGHVLPMTDRTRAEQNTMRFKKAIVRLLAKYKKRAAKDAHMC